MPYGLAVGSMSNDRVCEERSNNDKKEFLQVFYRVNPEHQVVDEKVKSNKVKNVSLRPKKELNNQKGFTREE